VSVNEEFPLSIGVVTPEASGEYPLGDVDAEEPQFSIIDTCVGIRKLGLAFAEGLDLRALEDDSALKGLKDVVVMAGSPIGRDGPISGPLVLGGVSLRLRLFGLCHKSKATGEVSRCSSVASVL